MIKTGNEIRSKKHWNKYNNIQLTENKTKLKMAIWKVRGINGNEQK